VALTRTPRDVDDNKEDHHNGDAYEDDDEDDPQHDAAPSEDAHDSFAGLFVVGAALEAWRCSATP
jgi:hypothetical protein